MLSFCVLRNPVIIKGITIAKLYFTLLIVTINFSIFDVLKPFISHVVLFNVLSHIFLRRDNVFGFAGTWGV
jgi:hypothetical protein